MIVLATDAGARLFRYIDGKCVDAWDSFDAYAHYEAIVKRDGAKDSFEIRNAIGDVVFRHVA